MDIVMTEVVEERTTYRYHLNIRECANMINDERVKLKIESMPFITLSMIEAVFSNNKAIYGNLLATMKTCIIKIPYYKDPSIQLTTTLADFIYKKVKEYISETLDYIKVSANVDQYFNDDIHIEL